LKAGGDLGIVIAILIFSIIVIFHEFGHFILAKQHGIVVTEFSIGMGPKLAGFTKRETLYCWRLLPFGGACIMMGEDEAMDEEGSFNSKSVWARMSVILAGPIFNFILAFVFAMFLISQTGYRDGEIASVEEGSPAMEAGLAPGDIITQVDDTKVRIFSDLTLYFFLNQGQEYEISYLRDGETNTVKVTPFLDENGSYRIGIGSVKKDANFLQLIQYSGYEVGYNIKMVVKSLGMIFSGQVTTNDIAGPVGMVSMIDDAYDQSIDYGIMSTILTMVSLVIILSANLGVMNLLPIPALDGGRMLFLIYEAIRGKPINREKEGLVNFVGFALLMVLMVFVLFNDIRRLFT